MARYERTYGGSVLDKYSNQDGRTATVARKHFSSTVAYQTWMKESLAESPQIRNGFGSDSPKMVPYGTDLLTGGDFEPVSQILNLVREIQNSVPALRLVWTSDVAGAFPNVPAYLAGEPESMFRQQHDASDHSPLRIWVGVSTSAIIHPREIVARGSAIAAFAMALSERRPVFITPYVLLGDWNRTQSAYISWDLQASPVVIAEVAASLGNQAITRHLGLEACYRLNPRVQGAWPKGYDNPEYMREILGCAPGDLFLGSAHAHDPMVKDPTGWVKKQLALHIAIMEDEN